MLGIDDMEEEQLLRILANARKSGLDGSSQDMEYECDDDDDQGPVWKSIAAPIVKQVCEFGRAYGMRKL